MAKYDTFMSVGGQKLEKALWPVDNPKGVVQLVHGMAEHIRRYDETAQQLNKAGYAVVGHTMPVTAPMRPSLAALAKAAGIP